LVASVVYSVALPPAGEVVVFVFVPFVVVSLADLPSLLCAVVITVLFSVVPFWLSQSTGSPVKSSGAQIVGRRSCLGGRFRGELVKEKLNDAP